MSGYERRAWDSDFFGLEIAQLSGDRAREATLATDVERARQAQVRCLYLLADATDTQAIRAAEGNGFELMDVRLTLERPIGAAPGGPLSPDHSIRHARPDDLHALEALARTSHRNTRFFADDRFPAGRVEEMYALWIRRSVGGELADAVHVIDVDGPRGYLTLSARNGVSTIGLVAVDEAFRGRGYGDRLLQSAVRWSAAKGLATLSVVTQGRNAGSVRFYERAGFVTNRVQFWYHRWF